MKERELEDLKSELEQQTLKSGETEKEREFNQSELDKLKERERSLGSEMKELKSKLKSAEDRVKREVFRAEEERRMAAETDAAEHVSDIYGPSDSSKEEERGT
jgi:predicted  nucleic acid-binding Zn-ribbon protein